MYYMLLCYYIFIAICQLADSIRTPSGPLFDAVWARLKPQVSRPWKPQSRMVLVSLEMLAPPRSVQAFARCGIEKMTVIGGDIDRNIVADLGLERLVGPHRNGRATNPHGHLRRVAEKFQ